MTEKYQAYHIFKGRDVSGSTIIEPPEKDGGRKPGETDKTITSQDGRLSPKLSELGLDYKISSLSQRIADLTNQLQALAVDIGISQRTLWYALQFYNKYPELNNVPDWNIMLLKIGKKRHDKFTRS